MAWWAKWMFWATAATTVITAAALWAIIRTLQHTRRAADAAADTVSAARDTIAVTREIGAVQTRAWLSVEIGLSSAQRGTTHFGVDGVYFKVFCIVKNHGHSPAMAVSSHAEACLMGDGRRPDFILRDFCERHPIMPDHNGEAVFPGAEYQANPVIFLPFSDIDESLSDPDSPAIFPLIYGCINYSTYGIEGMRQTGFASHLVTENSGRPVVIMGGDRKWLNEKLVLTSPKLQQPINSIASKRIALSIHAPSWTWCV